VYVDVPSQQGTFTGSVKEWNTENHADYGIIQVQLVSAVQQHTELQWNLFYRGFEGTTAENNLSFLLNHGVR
jgi:hypothetical protein